MLIYKQNSALGSTSLSNTCRLPRTCAIYGILFLLLPLILFVPLAHSLEIHEVAEQAEAAWLEGAINRALTMLDDAIKQYPHDKKLRTLRGDILTTSRKHREAIETYDAVLRDHPDALDVRWAKWSVLLRTGPSEEAIEEFQRIAQLDPSNPLVPFRLAQELRKLDRLEESLEWYKKAVALKPEMPGWRLALARAQFDVLDARGARDEVKRVLKMVEPGSPEELAARNLLAVVYGATKERGRRYEYIFTPEGTAADRKEWASIRADAWRLFEAGRFQEAETLYRRILTLNPSDYPAIHELGMTLIALDRCDEAIEVLDAMHTVQPSDEVYADTIFRIALCRVKAKQWDLALPYFEVLYDAAVEFEEAAREAKPEPDQRYLSKEVLAEWINKVKRHLPDQAMPQDESDGNIPPVDPPSEAAQLDEEYYRKLANEKLPPGKQLHPRASLMGRDADFSLFNYVIPANQVMRDNLPTGTHDFIPIQPGDTFPSSQGEIYLVFGLVTASYDEVMLTTQCYQETPKIQSKARPIAEDRIVMGMHEQTGYFILTPPEKGWPTGLYRCGLFSGHEVSAYTHADEVRFRIIESPPIS